MANAVSLDSLLLKLIMLKEPLLARSVSFFLSIYVALLLVNSFKKALDCLLLSTSLLSICLYLLR